LPLCLFSHVNDLVFFSGMFQLKTEFLHLEKPSFQMPKTYHQLPHQLEEELRKIFNPTSSMDPVSVQIQQLAAPLITADYRIIPIQCRDHIRYLVTDVNNLNYVVVMDLGGNGTCNCPSKYFCHHILACRFRSRAQSDLNIPRYAKLPKPSSHGAEKRKLPATLGNLTKRSRLERTNGKRKNAEEAEEDDEDFYLPEPQDVLFFTLSNQPLGLPPPPADHTGPVCVPPPPLGRCIPDPTVTRGFAEAVKLPNTDPPLVLSNPAGNSEFGAPEEETFPRPSASTASPGASPERSFSSGGGNAAPFHRLAEATVLLSRLPAEPASPSTLSSPWNPIMTSTPVGTLSACPITRKAKEVLAEEKRKAMAIYKGQEDVLDENPRTASFHHHGPDVTVITEELEEKQLRMCPKERRKFSFGSSLFTFETKEPGLVIIHSEKGDVPSTVRRSAATAGANQALSRLNSTDSSKVYTVKVSIHVEGAPATDLTDPQEFEVSCVCGKAMSRRELGPSTINCSICQRMFHKEHTNNPTRRRTFKCLACSQPIQGLRWGAPGSGGKYQNTCPIDGFLTAASLAIKQKPSLLKDLRAFGELAEQHLATALEQALQNNSEAAQAIWGDYIINYGPKTEKFRSETDLFGDLFSRTVEALGPSVTFNLRTFCPNGNLCSSKRNSVRTIRESSLPADCSSVKIGLDFLLDETVKQCEICLDDRGNPLVGYKKMVIPNPKKPPVFFYVATSLLKFTPEEYMQGPQEVVVQDIKYRLHSINLFSAPSAHYRTLISVGEEGSPSWLLYDGIAANTLKKEFTRFRPAYPSDYSNQMSAEGYVASSLVFLRV